MNDLLTKTAALLDSLADAEDARPVAPDPFLDRVSARMGGRIPDDVRQKLSSDESLRRFLEPIMAAPETTRPLGGPSEKSAAPVALSNEERMRQANENFINTVMGRNG